MSKSDNSWSGEGACKSGGVAVLGIWQLRPAIPLRQT